MKEPKPNREIDPVTVIVIIIAILFIPLLIAGFLP